MNPPEPDGALGACNQHLRRRSRRRRRGQFRSGRNFDVDLEKRAAHFLERVQAGRQAGSNYHAFDPLFLTFYIYIMVYIQKTCATLRNVEMLDGVESDGHLSLCYTKYLTAEFQRNQSRDAWYSRKI